jgi:protein SCO1/2
MNKLKIVILGLILFLVACGGKEIETNMSQNVEPFEFTTQSNDTLSNEDLKGQWWVADFVFTNCTTVCLPMTSNMSVLQSKMQDEDIDAQIVSFSVDPDRDTPEVLTDYAEEYGADLDNWNFLTGYDFDTIKELSIKSFKSMLAEAPPEEDQVTHGTGFYLVNPDGKIIKKYDGVDRKVMDEIIEDLKVVTKS